MGARDDDTITSLAGRLLRLAAVMDNGERKKAAELAGGATVNDIARDMLNAFDEDEITKEAGGVLSVDTLKQADDDRSAFEAAQTRLVERAVKPIFSAELRNYLENVRKSHDQIIDNETWTPSFLLAGILSAKIPRKRLSRHSGSSSSTTRMNLMRSRLSTVKLTSSGRLHCAW